MSYNSPNFEIITINNLLSDSWDVYFKSAEWPVLHTCASGNILKRMEIRKDVNVFGGLQLYFMF